MLWTGCTFTFSLLLLMFAFSRMKSPILSIFQNSLSLPLLLIYRLLDNKAHDLVKFITSSYSKYKILNRELFLILKELQSIMMLFWQMYSRIVINQSFSFPIWNHRIIFEYCIILFPYIKRTGSQLWFCVLLGHWKECWKKNTIS